jgi:hypothetical protein
VPITTDLSELKIYELAELILEDWPRPYFGAVPYLTAMCSLSSLDDDYGFDSGETVVIYFLSNANTWKGETARTIKAELKRRLK